MNLTHNLIASKAGFRSLMDIYDRDGVIAYRNRIKDYIKKNSIVTDFSDKTFGEVIDILAEGKVGNELRAIHPTAGQQAFIEDNPQLYQYALQASFSSFSKIYLDKDKLLDDKKQDEEDEGKKGSKRDNLIKHLFNIQHNITLYQTGRYNEFLRKTDYRSKLVSIQAKKELKENIEALVNTGDKSIDDVIKEANQSGICLIDDNFTDFIDKDEYVFQRVSTVPYKEFQCLCDYLEGMTPFSTQHKTKGAEFDNVLVRLDNGGWNNYNFEKMFLRQALKVY